MQHPKPWLRFVEARKIEDQTLDIDGMKVRNDAGDKLGKVDGMIVDAESGRTYYVVVDAGGWFKSKEFLLPIGEVRLDGDRDALVVGLTKEQIERFPGFDTSEFDGLSASDIKRINDETCRVFQPTSVYPQDEPYYAAWNRASYQYPDWWNTEPTLPERVGESVYEKEAEYQTLPAGTVTKREQSTPAVRAAANDTSPHFDGRAQPGDVLGIETGGEQSHVGDTKEDEDERRQKADDAARKNR